MKTFVPSSIFPSQYIYNKIRWNEPVLSFKNHCPNTVTIVHKRLHSCKLYYSLTFTVVSLVHFCTSVFQALRRRYGDTSLQAEAAVRFLQDMIPTVSLINKDLHLYLLPLFEQRTQIQQTAQEKVYLYEPRLYGLPKRKPLFLSVPLKRCRACLQSQNLYIYFIS